VLRHALLALLVITTPIFAQEAVEEILLPVLPDLPDGYPPKMGEVSGSFGGTPVAWETFDFSIGAYDASAWVGMGYETEKIEAHLMAYPVDDPDTKAGRIYAHAEFGAAFRTGKGRNVTVEIYQGDDRDGPRLSSEGKMARLVIDSIGPATEGSYSRRVVGRIEARLCPVDWKGQDCQDIALQFDTDMQVESTVPVRE